MKSIYLSFTISILAFLQLNNAHAFELSSPVGCVIGSECFIQNYVDRDVNKDKAKDYRCKAMSYDGHKGTDFRVPTMAEVEAGVAVLATADGIIQGKRDGMPDIDYHKVNRKILIGKECGNGVVISHADGWETQYCHMKKGSITIEEGQEIKAGDKIGEIGLSGKTEFPHLHLSVRKDGEHIDPFSNERMTDICSKDLPDSNLWNTATQEMMTYKEGGFLAGSFTTHEPDKTLAMKGGERNTTLPVDADAMIFWALSYGLQAGDQMVTKITTPSGMELARDEQFLNKNKAQYFKFIGKKRTNFFWSKGEYIGHFEIWRSGIKLSSNQITLIVE